MSIGGELRKAREEMGASLEDVEKETKIRSKYIAAIEEDKFDVLPGKVYVRGFLRNYARFLGVDGEALVDQYDELFVTPTELEHAVQTQDSFTDNVKRNSVWRKGFAVMAVVLLVGAIIYWGGSNELDPQGKVAEDNHYQDPTNQSGEPGHGNEGMPQNNNVPGSDKGDNAFQEESQNQGVDMVLEVTDKECWMQVMVDNENVFVGTVEPNNIKKFAGQESIWLKLGNAGAVKVWANGKDYGFLGAPGEVITKTFPEDKNIAGG